MGKKFYYFFLFLILVGFLLTGYWFFGGYHVAMSTDSTLYITYSLDMKCNFNFNCVRTAWPPLYPFFLFLFGCLTPVPINAASLVSFVSLILTGVVTVYLINKSEANTSQKLILCLTILFLYPFWVVFIHAWSESIFSLFLAIHILFIYKYLASEREYLLILAGAASSCAALTRYAGYTVLLAFSLLAAALVIGKLKKPPRYYIYTVIFWLPSGVWAIRNYFIDKTLHGPRVPSKYNVFGNIYHLITVFKEDLGIILAILILGGLVISAMYIKKRTINILSYLFVFILVYLTFILGTSSLVTIDRLNTRFLASIYPLLIILLAFSIPHLDQVLHFPNTRLRNGLIIILLAVSLVNHLQFFSLHMSKEKILNPFHYGTGFERTTNGGKIRNFFAQKLKPPAANISVSVIVHYCPSVNYSMVFRDILPEFYRIVDLDRQFKKGRYTFTVKNVKNGRLKKITFVQPWWLKLRLSSEEKNRDYVNFILKDLSKENVQYVIVNEVLYSEQPDWDVIANDKYILVERNKKSEWHSGLSP